MMFSLLVGCGEAPAEVTTTTAQDVTTTVADDVTTTVADGVTTTVADEDPTTDVQDETTTAVDKTTTVGKNETTTAGDKATATKKPDATTKKPDVTTKKPNETTKKVTTTTTKKTTTTKTTAPTTQKVYGTTLFMDWNETSRTLQVVQKYSKTQDLVVVVKPIKPNNILNIVAPKTIANTSDTVSNELAKATHSLGTLTESDWLVAHNLGGGFVGGSHGSDPENTLPTGHTQDITVKVNGRAIEGSGSMYGGEVELKYVNYLYYNTSLKNDPVLTETYTLVFDGEKVTVDCQLHFLKDEKWNRYYGVSCVYGCWSDSITYGDERPNTKIATDGNASTEAESWNCDTAVLRKNNHALELWIDHSYGLGRGTHVDKKNDPGIFTAAYGSVNAGKAYAMLVKDRSVRAGAKFMWRGSYRFFYEG